jgi:hypothetical protein
MGIHTPLLTSQGRLDVSAHPFTGETHPTDVRMTTRFKEGCLMEGLQGAIHETGHALYEQVRFTLMFRAKRTHSLLLASLPYHKRRFKLTGFSTRWVS